MGLDKVKQRIRSKAYYEKHRNEVLGKGKKRYNADKEYKLQKNKEWRDNNKYEVQQYQHEWYTKHKETKLMQAKLRCQCIKKFINEDALKRGCTKCGFRSCAQSLHFHHRDPKTKKFEVSQGWAYTMEKIQEEMDKCDVLCANCHIELHSCNVPVKSVSSRSWTRRYVRHKKFRDRVVLRCGCSTCGYKKHVNALHFHHQNPRLKDFAVSWGLTYSFNKLKNEMRKCTILCANCHTMMHCASQICTHGVINEQS